MWGRDLRTGRGVEGPVVAATRVRVHSRRARGIRRRCLAMSCAALLSAAACGVQDGNEHPRRLVFAGGGMGGGTYSTLSAFAHILMKHSDLGVKVVPGGGLINLVRVSRGELDATIGNVPFMRLGARGEGPFTIFADRQDNFRTVMQPAGGRVVVHFVVNSDVPLDSAADIGRGTFPLRLAVDRKGTHDNWILEQVLGFYGVDTAALRARGGGVREVGYNDQIMLLADGQVDGVLQNMQVPSGSLMEVSSRRSLKFLDLPPDLVEHMVSIGWSEVPSPAPLYEHISGDPEASSVGYMMPLIVNADLPEEVVYEMTRVFCEHPDETRGVHRAWRDFDPRTAWQNTGGELHPGARRYYVERGYMPAATE